MGMPRTVPGSGHQDTLNRLYNSPIQGLQGGNAQAGAGVGTAQGPAGRGAAGLAPQQVAALGVKANELLAQAKKAHAAGKIQQAEKLYKESLSIRYRIWGERDINIPKVLDILTDMCLSSGRTDEAIIYLQSILKFYDKRVGPGTPERIPALMKLASISQKQKKYVEECSLTKQVYGLMERKSGVTEKELVQAKIAYADAAYRAKYFKESERLYRSVVELKEKNGETVSFGLASNYADVLKNNGYEVEAEAILKKYQPKEEASTSAAPESTQAPAATEKPTALSAPSAETK